MCGVVLHLEHIKSETIAVFAPISLVEFQSKILFTNAKFQVAHVIACSEPNINFSRELHSSVLCGRGASSSRFSPHQRHI